MSRSILLLGTGNETRSIMAEAYINQAGSGMWRAHSAGTSPVERVHPLTMRVLAGAGIAVTGEPRPKNCSLFCGPTSPPMDVIVAVCREAAEEGLLHWPGAPRILYWPAPDPLMMAGANSEDLSEAFKMVLEFLRDRADLFLADNAFRRI